MPDHAEILGWIRGLPGPVAVSYEAGPTGYGLARFLIGEGIDTLVAAASRLQRPSGDGVKTDVRDAGHLARLLHLGEIVATRQPVSNRSRHLAHSGIVPGPQVELGGDNQQVWPRGQQCAQGYQVTA